MAANRRYSADFMFETSKLLEYCTIGNLEGVQKLLEQGANVNEPSYIGRSPLHGAVLGGQKDVCLFLLHNGADPNAQDAGGSTPLHYATQNGDAEMEKILLSSGGDINQKNTSGQTPLHLACKFGKTDCVKILLELGADVNAVANDGQNAMAMAGNQREIGMLLLNPKYATAKPQKYLGDNLKQAMFRRRRIDELQQVNDQQAFLTMSPRP